MPKETLNKSALKWPYPIRYEQEKEVNADVLVLGGGIAGCHAAINAARKGARVVIVDKGPIIRSGSGGAGVDHWGQAITNPCCQITPEEKILITMKGGGFQGTDYVLLHSCYIEMKESWPAVLDMEKFGMKIRDVDDEFTGAEFRDEKTRLLFAYDYKTRHTLRVQGENVKVCLYKELKRLGIEMYERVMATSLLTEGGKQGARVTGATGFNVRTGEFYVFKSRATVLTTAQPRGIWVFNMELQGFAGQHHDPNNAGDGTAMAWDAGAECGLLERTHATNGPFRYPAYGVGGSGNTWYACTVVDANGKEVPWVDRDGNVLKTVSERYYPVKGQRLWVPGAGSHLYEVKGPTLIPDLPERIKKGEFVLPLYADLPSMPPAERRAIFGLMVGNEGKTRIIYDMYTKAGFDPDKDMLQLPVTPPDAYGPGGNMNVRQWRETFTHGGGIMVDWDMRTNIEGLYAAGAQLAGAVEHPQAATTGRYAGRKAAVYALEAKEATIDRRQVENEKKRVYAPIKRKDGIGWKDLQSGICRIMQDYCGEYKSKETLELGLEWLKSIRESEGSNAYARNPHELMRTLECMVRITVSEMIMQASLARKASSKDLDFKRIDYPAMDPPDWKKIITLKLANGKVKTGELPVDYPIKPPYAPTFKENYDKHCGI